MIHIKPDQLPHFAQGVLNGWQEAKTGLPAFYQANGKTTQEQRHAYIMGWKLGREHHARPYINHACLRGIEPLKIMLEEERIVEVAWKHKGER